MASEETLRAQLVETSRALHQRGWVANHDGNVTARLGPGRFLSTPTAVSKGAVSGEMLIVVDGSGEVVQGTRKAFSELKLHLAAYRIRPDIGCCIHAHPPTATGFAVAQRPLGAPFMAEPVVSIGREVPLVPFGMPGQLDLAELLRSDVLLLANHGVLAVGPDLETALLRIELVEHVARIALVAHQLGGAVPLPEHLVATLQKKHEGLFPKGPVGDAQAQSVASPSAASTPEAARDIVSDALKRFQ